MGQKACDKCGELVDEAKAFCPACGNAFVDEEQRQDTSAFEKMDNTVQMGKTMYGQMLSDMGLNISKAPDAPPPPPEKRVEVIAPLTTNATPAANVTPPPEQQAAPPAKKSYLVWIIVGAIVLIFLLILLISIAGVIFYYYGNRLT
jgi:uncharacterized membrane protein YvbJ